MTLSAARAVARAKHTVMNSCMFVKTRVNPSRTVIP